MTVFPTTAADPASQQARVQRFLIPLLLSLLLHALLVVLLARRESLEAPVTTTRSNLVVSLTLSKRPEKTPLSSIAPKPPGSIIDAPVETGPAKPADSRRPSDAGAASSARSGTTRQPRGRPQAREPLDLSLPTIRPDAAAVRRGESEAPNAATIFDKELIDRLQQLRSQNTRRGMVPIPGVDVERSHSAFSAGRWETRLRVGDQCFLVIEADPLEPLSNEQWYAVACR